MKECCIYFKELLEGAHVLSGVGSGTIELYQGEEVNTVDLCIDGVVFSFYEDPNDGFRSYGGVCKAEYDGRVYRFAPQPVIIKYEGGRDYGSVLTLVDKWSKKLILEVGTDYTDDFYPMAIFHYHPENMSVNNNYGVSVFALCDGSDRLKPEVVSFKDEGERDGAAYLCIKMKGMPMWYISLGDNPEDVVFDRFLGIVRFDTYMFNAIETPHTRPHWFFDYSVKDGCYDHVTLKIYEVIEELSVKWLKRNDEAVLRSWAWWHYYYGFVFSSAEWRMFEPIHHGDCHRIYVTDEIINNLVK